MNLKTANFPLQVAIATLLYNVLHILAWELPIAVRLSWDVNIIGDIIVIAASTLGMILIAFGKKAGLILAVIPASWAIFFQWFIVYFILGYKEPNGVWWYPLFPIFQGINIVFFCILAYRNLDRQSLPEQKTGNGLRSPSYYLYAASAFLLVHTGQKFVREMVVGFLEYGDGGMKGVIPSALLASIAILAAILLIMRSRWGLILAFISGGILVIQPVIYHIIMGKPCTGNIWWYPFFTLIQGAFIVYFSILVLLKDKENR